MDFMTGVSIWIDWKGDKFDSILVIVDWLIKMVYYKPVKITINAPKLGKVIINVVVYHYSLLNLIITNKGFFFILKFWSLLCYFLSIKHRFLTAFYSQIDSQTKKQNNIIETYFQAFFNFE